MTMAQLYLWLRQHPCECDVDKAEKCILATGELKLACSCECHAKIAECHNDRRYA